MITPYLDKMLSAAEELVQERRQKRFQWPEYRKKTERYVTTIHRAHEELEALKREIKKSEAHDG